MTKYVALLRAVNVGGAGKLRMSCLVAICRDAGFSAVGTYIASGNVVFESKARASKVKSELEGRLHAHAGKPIGVMVRTAFEMQAVLDANPFPKAKPNCAYVLFLDEAPPSGALREVTGRNDEEMRLGKREIFIHYPSGMGRSKLKIPVAKLGTARNINTVTALVDLAR